MMAIKKTGLKRDTVDKFYTKTTVAADCIQTVKSVIIIDQQNDIIIEPSAGNGSFISEIKKISNKYLFYDIEPENNDIINQNYLEIDFSKIELINTNTKIKSKIHIIGNPPFGRQSTLAIQFIKKSAEIADSISFILPKSFKKESMMRHFPTKFHLLYQKDIEKNSFLVEGNATDVPCVFQVWQKQENDRNVIIKEMADPKIYKFVKQEEIPDISFRRVGVNAGVIDDKNISEKSIQSHYFIKFGPGINKKELISKMKLIQYETNNTVGPKSICKSEIIREINKII
jgi:predicted RNA methylase